MKYDDFVQEISRLEKWCKREFTEEQKQTLFEQMRGWPVEAVKDVVTSLIESIKPNSQLPTIQEFKEEFLNWLKGHPEKIAYEYEQHGVCSECGGKGYFEVVYDVSRAAGIDGETRIVEYVTLLPCAMCNNWIKTFGKKPKKLWTKEEIKLHPRFYLKENDSKDAGEENGLQADS